MTAGTKGGAQRASSLRPRCFREVDPETATHVCLSICGWSVLNLVVICSLETSSFSSCVTFWVVLWCMVFNSWCFGTLCLFHLHGQVDAKIFASTCLWRWNRHSVPKRRLLNTICQRTTEEVTHDIENTTKTLNQELAQFHFQCLCPLVCPCLKLNNLCVT
jgi:hypothetical protein